MSIGRHLAKNYHRKTIRCGKCGVKMWLSGKSDMSGKRHAHCKNCRLEWHLTVEGRYYAHPITVK